MNVISADVILGLNYPAIAVVALAAFFLGGLWYSPVLFGKAWMEANDYDADQVSRMQRDLGIAGFGTTLAAYLVMAFALALVAEIVAVDSAVDGIAIAAVAWLGFVAAPGLTINLFSTRPLSAWAIDAGCHGVALLIGGIVLATWQ